MINESVELVLLNVVNIFWNCLVMMLGILWLFLNVCKFLIDNVCKIGLKIVLIILFLLMLKN